MRADFTLEFAPAAGASVSGPPQVYMSGEVTGVGSFPTSIRPGKDCTDYGQGKGSLTLGRELVGFTFTPQNGLVDPSRQAPKWGRFCYGCHGIHGYDYESTCPAEIKSGVMAAFHRGNGETSWDYATFGPPHGTEVTVQARLHFDYDFLRGSEEGPWGDGIPLDGRDIWEVTLQCNDAMGEYWCLKIGSLRNLGPNVKPRCWPWSKGNQLPIDRTGVDEFPISYLMPRPSSKCIGAFGCPDVTHGH